LLGRTGYTLSSPSQCSSSGRRHQTKLNTTNDVEFTLSAFFVARPARSPPRSPLHRTSRSADQLSLHGSPADTRRGSRRDRRLISRKKHSAPSLACPADTAPTERGDETARSRQFHGSRLGPRLTQVNWRPELTGRSVGRSAIRCQIIALVGACRHRYTACTSGPDPRPIRPPREPGFTEGRQGGLHGSIRSRRFHSFHIDPVE
jgi:hypothetical protein